MNEPSMYVLYFSVYTLVFLVVVLSIWVWQIRRRGEKPPLMFKLLRAPGESLRRRMIKFDESALFLIFGAAVVPILVGLFALKLLFWFTPALLYYGLALSVVATIIALILAGRFVMTKFTRNRNDRLGYLGERAVGEMLTSLPAHGYHVFHDVPLAISEKIKFNIDHVAVGPNGVFAIETKTRRKGRARAGFEAHKVIYDGRQLIWPWAEDSHGLEQAQFRARSLSEWLNKMTGLGLAAHPVLVLPGWFVVLKALGPVTVVSHKQLVGSICRVRGNSLAHEQVDLIARQLDLLCRDVED